MQNPRFIPLDEEADEDAGMLPIYPLTQGLQQGFMRNLTRQALKDLGPLIPEPIPRAVRQKAKLAAVRYAYETIHYPGGPEEYKIARERLAFEELFLTPRSSFIAW